MTEAVMISKLMSGEISGQEAAREVVLARERARQVQARKGFRLVKAIGAVAVAAILGPFVSGGDRSRS